MAKKIGMIIIIVGVFLILYPTLEKFYWDYQAAIIIREFEEVTSSRESSLESNDNDHLENPEYKDMTPSSMECEKQAQPGKEQGENGQEHDIQDRAEHARAIGIIRLPKIDIRLPIFYKATDYNLNIGAAQLKGTTPVGENGNTVISAHRNYTDNRFFSNLHKLSKGDEVLIETAHDTFVYEVYGSMVVEPEDTSVLKDNNKEDEKLLTLITCEPRGIGNYRLVVQAKLVNDSSLSFSKLLL